MDFQNHLNEIQQAVQSEIDKGDVVDYIPALRDVHANQWGMAVRGANGELAQAGAAEQPFSIQSISKVLALTLAIRERGDSLWQRVGREPSGHSFNSMIQLEVADGIPNNPLTNAGALVVTDELLTHFPDYRSELLGIVRGLSGNEGISCNLEIVESEFEAGNRNSSIAFFLKSMGNLKHPVNEVLDAYYHQCALMMSCLDLCHVFQFLVHGGVDPRNGERLVSTSQCKQINALMLTCGVNNASGDFAFRVGLPAKSGVGGGIVATLPGQFVATAWSPRLDRCGNSNAAVFALEMLTTRTGLSIF